MSNPVERFFKELREMRDESVLPEDEVRKQMELADDAEVDILAVTSLQTAELAVATLSVEAMSDEVLLNIKGVTRDCGCKFVVVGINDTYIHGRLHEMMRIALRLAASPLFPVASIGFDVIGATAAQHLAFLATDRVHASPQFETAKAVNEAMQAAVTEARKRIADVTEGDEGKAKYEAVKGRKSFAEIAEQFESTLSSMANEAHTKYGSITDVSLLADMLAPKFEELAEQGKKGASLMSPYPIPDGNADTSAPLPGSFAVGIADPAELEKTVVAIVDDLDVFLKAMEEVERRAFDADMERGKRVGEVLMPSRFVIGHMVGGAAAGKMKTLGDFHELSQDAAVQVTKLLKAGRPGGKLN
jgi:hypothetical protein